MKWLTGFALMFVVGCGTTAAQQKCIETAAISQLAVTVENALSCDGDRQCIENDALTEGLITADDAKACLSK